MQTTKPAPATDLRTRPFAASYRTEGYILFRQPVLTESRFNNLRTIFETMLANKGSLRSDELDTPHFKNPELLDYLLDDRVLDLVEPLIGPDIGLWSSHLICKEPFAGRATPWHDDSTYWEGRFDRGDGIVTIWLAIDKVDRENGCMKLLPCSHIGERKYQYASVTKQKTSSTAPSSALMTLMLFLSSWSPINVHFMIAVSCMAQTQTPVHAAERATRCGTSLSN